MNNNKNNNNSITTNGSSVVLQDVDDYIAPSQACVNPLFQGTNTSEENEANKEKSTNANTTTTAEGDAVVVPNRRRRVVRRKMNLTANKNDKNDNDNNSNNNNSDNNDTDMLSSFSAAIPNKKKSETTTKEDAIKASIADCLACSGCVTTAETVLLEQRHSLTSLKQRLLLKPNQRRAITISPNSWADLCRYWDLDDHDHEYYNQFATLLHQILQASFIIDGNLPLLWTWMDEAHEFVQVYQQNQKQKQQSGKNNNTDSTTTLPLPPPDPSIPMNSKKTTYYHTKTGTSEVVFNTNDPYAQIQSSSLPLISGSCPALVCLVEKSWNSLVPYLSLAQSPMSRMGNTLLSQHDDDDEKNNNNKKKKDGDSSSWDHWAIMPCHDKKLEASRQDFVNEDNQHAVDLVITTQELVQLVEEWMATTKTKTALHDISEPTNKSSISMKEYLKTLPAANHVCVSTPNDFVQKQQLGSSASSGCPATLITISTDTHQQYSWNDKDSNSSSSKDEGTATTTPDLWKQKQIAFSSGGHADFIFRYAAKKLFDCDISIVEWKRATKLAGANTKIRSARLAKKYAQQQHYYEAKLYRDETTGICTQQPSQSPSVSNSSTTTTNSTMTLVLHFAIVHGMQTLQRALKDLDEVRTLSSSSSVLQYVEAMACPFGCVNGGGIIRSSSSLSASRETPTETRERVQTTVTKLTVPEQQQQQSELLQEPSPQRMYTRYHVVPPMQHTMGAAAGVKVQDMQW